MSTNERVREQGFCYDQDSPPSVPAGAPLREVRSAPGRPTSRRSYRVRLDALRGRLHRDA